MHDWTLINIDYNWAGKVCLLSFRDSSSELKEVKAIGVLNVNIPHVEEWGSSSSVNEVSGPEQKGNVQYMDIQMQSGDVIHIEASEITRGSLIAFESVRDEGVVI